jgi:hypothetical protein
MYHKSTHQDSKERILTQFKSGSSRIRCIIALLAMKTCQCPKFLHVKDATYKSARVLLINVVQYVLQNVNAKRGASYMNIHCYLHVGTSPVNEDCLARRL